MPGYSKTDGSAVICFFREDKYVTFGLTENANFGAVDGKLPQLTECAWLLTSLDDQTKDKIVNAIKRATI